MEDQPRITVTKKTTKNPTRETEAGTKLVNLVNAMLRSEGWLFRIVGNMRQLSGLPDAIGVIRGRFVALEFKFRHKIGTVTNITPKQLNTLLRFADADAEAYCMCYIEESKIWMIYHICKGCEGYDQYKSGQVPRNLLGFPCKTLAWGGTVDLIRGIGLS